MSRAGVFAGTFDPVHSGHVDFALVALDKGGLDKIYFLPERQPRGKHDVTDYSHRLKMLELTLENHSRLKILELPEPNFSVAETLPKLNRLSDSIVLIMGSDVAQALPGWDKSSELMNSAEIIVGLREATKPQELPGMLAKATVIISPRPLVSAGQVRSREHQEVLHPKVIDYARRHRLY